MREFIGIAIASSGLAFAAFMLYEGRTDWTGFLAVSSSSLIVGVVVANLSRVKQLKLRSESVGEVSVIIDQKVQQVEARAQDVEKLAREVTRNREEVTLLLQNVNAANEKMLTTEVRVGALVGRADSTEQEVSKVKNQIDESLQSAQAVQTAVGTMEVNVRVMFQSVFESFAYAITTRNLFPAPAFINQKIQSHVNNLASFAYPDPTERDTVIKRMNEDVKRAQAGEGQSSPLPN